MLKIRVTILALLVATISFAQEIDSTEIRIQSIENSLKYQTGTIELASGNATLTVPKGFRYLDQNQSIFVLTDLWGNPADSSVLGLLVPENRGVLAANSWVFTIKFDDMGFVKDEDADDIDYDDLLKEQQKETDEANPERINQGYPPIEFVGWASAPYYDKEKKVLHWAKELRFGEDSLSTLNYNLRILGRKGVFVVNAIATMPELPEVKANIDQVLGSIQYKEGQTYADFDPELDEVAAWTIGGLVAGKLLAKAGFFVIFLKFWKVIALAFAGAGGAIWNYFKKKKGEEPTQKPTA
ncbi:MAG: DUF2167 domain-containing protein [Cyclobacteriaceae bacterium]|nr:DUF2167 domain-containing protein [Cyclobacteriaceae bacterium]